MTITNTTVKASYSGNGSTTTFAIPFTYFEESDVTVYLRDENVTPITETLLTEGVGNDYTLTGGDAGAGVLPTNVEMNTAPASGEKLVVIRDVPLTQTTDYITGDEFPAESHEAALDKNVASVQEMQEEVDRSLKFSVTSESAGKDFPDPEALKYVRWNAAGTELENVDGTNDNAINAAQDAAIALNTAHRTDDAVTLTGTQTVTNKSLPHVDFPHQTTPANPASGNVRVYSKNDELLYKLDSAGNEIPIGTGGGGALNFYDKGDAESAAVSDFATGNNSSFLGGGTLAGTFSISETADDLIRGSKSFKLVGNATAGNNDDDYVSSTAINIPQGYRGQTLGLKFQYKSDLGDSNIVAQVYDTTNTVLLTDGTNFVPQYDDSTNNTSTEYSLVFFCPADCEQIQLGFQVITGEVSKTFIWDDVNLTPDPYLSYVQDRENSFGARIDNNGTATIVAQTSDFIGSVNRTSAGLVTVTWKAGFFTVAPSVTIIDVDNTSSIRIQKVLTCTTTECTLRSQNTSNSPQDVDLFLHAERVGADYKDPMEHLVVRSSGVQNHFGAQIANNGTATISNQTEDFIASVNRSGAGVVDVTWKSGFFSVAPVVNATFFGAVSATFISVVSASTTGCQIQTRNSGTTAADLDFNLTVNRQGNDYSQPNAVHTALAKNRFAQVWDQKASSTDGGASVAGSWETRDLNQSQGGEGWLTLGGSNTFTLEPGSYKLKIKAPANEANGHRCRLYSVSGSAEVSEVTSTSHYATTGTTQNDYAFADGSIDITSSTEYRVEHRVQVSKASSGHGVQSALAAEIYTVVEIEKVG